MSCALSIVFSTYNQPHMLATWFERWGQQPKGHRDQCEVVVVDDCSHPAVSAPETLNVSMLRVDEDRPWNQGMARNLGVLQAVSSVVLLIDVDMTFQPDSLKLFLDAAIRHKLGEVQRPILQHFQSKKLDASSPNVHMMTKKDFIAVRGYDARYAGRKGWGDVTLLRVFERKYRTRRRNDLILTLHHDDPTIEDAQVKTLSRSSSHNKKVHVEHMELVRLRGIDGYIASKPKDLVDLPWRRIL